MAKPPGLRERKKLAAMQHIQTVAMDLFDERGYDAVTIEQVAAAADVSPSTVYRYFGTKEHLVLYDEYDPLMIDILDRADQDTAPVTTIRRVLQETILQIPPQEEGRIRRRLKYTFSIPAINAAMVQDAEDTETLIREAFARQTGLDADDFELRVFAASIVAAFLTALRYWYDHEGELTLFEGIERALDVIEHDLAPPRED